MFDNPRSRSPRLRTHAVSAMHGDYEDDDEGRVEFGEGDEEAFPSRDEEGDWKATPPAKRSIYGEGAEGWTDGAGVDKEELAQAQWLAKEEKAMEDQRKRWMENAKPPIRVRQIDERGRSYGRGSRKTASARVWIEPGEGIMTVNRLDFVEYFTRETDREHVMGPLVATETCGKFDVKVFTQGGGLTGQAGAVRLGLARALQNHNPQEFRPPLKRLGYMTRDPRMVERKKIGHKKARKSPQWVKR